MEGWGGGGRLGVSPAWIAGGGVCGVVGARVVAAAASRRVLEGEQSRDGGNRFEDKH